MLFKTIKLKKNKKIAIASLCFLGLFFYLKPSFAEWSLNPQDLLNAVLLVFFQLAVILLAISSWLLEQVISPEMYTSVFFSDVAKEGINSAWGFVRDFFNLFFILIVLLVGISVILGVGKFKDKAILFKVLMAALLVNFSKAIVLFIIDFSQVAMSFFADALNGKSIAIIFGKLVNMGVIFDKDMKNETALSVAIIVSIFLVLVLAIMIFYLAISLLVRYVAFWVIIILSPIASVGFVLEGTKLGGMKNDIISKLVSWCFYGPILLFFIWLSLILVDNVNEANLSSNGVFSTVGNVDTLKTDNDLSSFFATVAGFLIPYIVAVYLLFYGYDLAKKTSTGVASKILGAGEKKLDSLNNFAKGFYRKPMAVATGGAKIIGGGLKSGAENLPFVKNFTKKGHEDNVERWKAFARREEGDGGEALRSYYEKKAQEQLKTWKDSPPEKDELKKAFESKNRDERIAATLYMSQNNQIKTLEDYKKAKTNLEGHKGLQEKLEREMGKENLGVLIQASVEDKIKKEESNGILKGLDKESDEYKVRAAAFRENIYKEKLQGKNNKNLFSNQNISLYKDNLGMMEYLAERSLNQTYQQRSKVFEDIKSEEVEKFIRGYSDKDVVDFLSGRDNGDLNLKSRIEEKVLKTEEERDLNSRNQS